VVSQAEERGNDDSRVSIATPSRRAKYPIVGVGSKAEAREGQKSGKKEGTRNSPDRDKSGLGEQISKAWVKAQFGRQRGEDEKAIQSYTTTGA